MLSTKNIFSVIAIAIMSLSVSISAAPIADVLCNYERGLNTNPGYATPEKAVSPDGTTIPSGLVSLGTWSDDPGYGDGDPVGIILGFSTSILNGTGNDLKVVGNPFTGWYEPGYVEVARESSGLGAVVDGWRNEQFYLLKGSNYDNLPNDPRDSAISMSNFSQSDLGYTDVAPGGDYMDIDWAIDTNGDSISLADIAYVRVRTVTDDSAGMFGYYTTELNYIEALNGVVPEPATMSLLALGGLALLRRRRKA